MSPNLLLKYNDLFFSLMGQQDQTYRLDMGDLYGELAGHANLVESVENEHLERSPKTN